MSALQYPFLIYWSFLLVSYLYSSEKIQALNTRNDQYTEQRHCNTITSSSPDSVCRPPAGQNSMANRTADQVEKTSDETNNVPAGPTNFTTITLPVTFGRWSHTDKYAVVLGLGSPKQELSLLFNTVTNLMWTRCTDKSLDAVRLDLYFNSNASTNYLTVPCDSCNAYNLPPEQQDCLNGTCVYKGTYDDGQSSDTYNGLLSFDKLNISDHEYSDFIFVCVPYDPPTDSVKSDAGLLGLGRGADYPSYYFINIISISVGTIELKMDYSKVFLNRGIAVDPGTSITRLPALAYAALRDEFRKQIGNSHPMSAPHGILDTCYNTSGSRSQPAVEIDLPTISFTFEDNVKVDFNGPQIFEDSMYTTLKCLAFADNTNPPSVSFLGNTQQKTMEVAYDLDTAGGRLGFRPNACK
ncbi:hypothetical protein OROGR_027022 [Orobanche gracilis]